VISALGVDSGRITGSAEVFSALPGKLRKSQTDPPLGRN